MQLTMRTWSLVALAAAMTLLPSLARADIAPPPPPSPGSCFEIGRPCHNACTTQACSAAGICRKSASGARPSGLLDVLGGAAGTCVASKGKPTPDAGVAPARDSGSGTASDAGATPGVDRGAGPATAAGGSQDATTPAPAASGTSPVTAAAAHDPLPSSSPADTTLAPPPGPRRACGVASPGVPASPWALGPVLGIALIAAARRRSRRPR